MKLSPPKQITFYIAALLWLLGLVNVLAPASVAMLPAVGWYAIVGGLLLILGCAIDGL